MLHEYYRIHCTSCIRCRRLGNLEATPLRRGGTFDGKLPHAFGMCTEGTGKLSKDSSQFVGVGSGHGLRAQLAYAIVQPSRPGLRSEEAGEQVSVRRLPVVSFAMVHSREDTVL